MRGRAASAALFYWAVCSPVRPTLPAWARHPNRYSQRGQTDSRSMSAFYCFLQVLNPNSAYGGHHPMIPVANGITPSQPQADCGPMNTRLMIASPAMTRTTRSTLLTFCFMVSPGTTMSLDILLPSAPNNGLYGDGRYAAPDAATALPGLNTHSILYRTRPKKLAPMRGPFCFWRRGVRLRKTAIAQAENRYDHQ